MAKSLVERRLIELGDRLKTLRVDLRVADEQLAQLAEEAEESRLRSLVSETPLAERDEEDEPAEGQARTARTAAISSDEDHRGLQFRRGPALRG